MSILDLFGPSSEPTKTKELHEKKAGFIQNIFSSNKITKRNAETKQITPELVERLDDILPGDYLEYGYVPQKIKVDGNWIDGPKRTWEELCDGVHDLLQKSTYPEDTESTLSKAKPDYLAMLYHKNANEKARKMLSYAAFEIDAQNGFRWGVNSDIISFTHPLAYNAMFRSVVKRRTPQIWKVCKSCQLPIRVSHEQCPFCDHTEFISDERNIIIAAQREAEATIKGILRNDWLLPSTWDGVMIAQPYGDDQEIIADPIEIIKQTKVTRLTEALKFSLKGWPPLGTIRVDYSWCRGNTLLERSAEEKTESHNNSMQTENLNRRLNRAYKLQLI